MSTAAAFDGLRVAFTGRPDRLPRRQAEALVRASGGVPVPRVTHRTYMLVVGMPCTDGASCRPTAR